MIDKNFSLDKVNHILEGNRNFFVESSDELNKYIDHIVQLILDAYILYINNAFTSSTFLSITIIEEVGKVHMGIYIEAADSYVKKDKLRDHKWKQIVGASYSVCMSERINEAISSEKLEELFKLVYSGDLKDLREKTIYCDRKNGDILTPKDTISQEFSRNLLLFAIEIFDDNLVGYTYYSIEVSNKTDIIFKKIVES